MLQKQEIVNLAFKNSEDEERHVVCVKGECIVARGENPNAKKLLEKMR